MTERRGAGGEGKACTATPAISDRYGNGMPQAPTLTVPRPSAKAPPIGKGVGPYWHRPWYGAVWGVKESGLSEKPVGIDASRDEFLHSARPCGLLFFVASLANSAGRRTPCR